MFSTCSLIHLFVHTSSRAFIRPLPNFEHNVFKMNELILMPNSASGK